MANPVFALLLSAAVAALTASLAPAAEAQAPIRYGPAAAAPPPAEAPQPPAAAPDRYAQAHLAPARLAPSGTAAPGAKTARLEFRYPDQQDVVHSGGHAFAAGHDDPMVFSSAKAALTEQDAQTVMGAPQMASAPAIAMAGAPVPPRAPRPLGRATAASLAASAAVMPSVPAASAPSPMNVPAPAAFTPLADTRFDQQGLATVYDPSFQGRPTASGELYDATALTAAHETLPLPSLVRVRNTATGQEAVVRVNDRGGFAADGSVIDLSPAAAAAIGAPDGRPASVDLAYIGPAPVSLSEAPTPAPAASEVPLYVEAAVAAPLGAPAPAMAPIAALPFPERAPSAPGHGHQGFYVQIGAFADIGNAQKAHMQLGASLPVEIREADVRGDTFFRVLVGPFASQTAALQERDRLRIEGFADGIIRKDAI